MEIRFIHGSGWAACRLVFIFSSLSAIPPFYVFEILCSLYQIPSLFLPS